MVKECFTGISDKPGCGLADDMYNEHLNRFLVKTLSANRINAQILESKSKSLFFVHQLRVTYLREVQVLNVKSTKDVRRDQDFQTILEKLESLNLFQFVQGRHSFKKFG